MKMIRHAHTLFSYDGPQVFEAQDTTGGQYISADCTSVAGRIEFL